MRLSAPTKTTFWTATLLLVLALVDRFAFDLLSSEWSFGAAALGGVILWIGSVFNRV